MKRSREPEDSPPPLSPSSSHSPPSTALSDSDGPTFGSNTAATTTTTTTTMICQLHRDHLTFPSSDAYETHYYKEHVNRCLECRRNFPSQHYLGLHVDECHDPFVAVRRDNGEHTFACFVQGCERKCASSDKRRRHLIDKHHFPRNFYFAITQHGIDGRHSLLSDDSRRHNHRRQSSSTSHNHVVNVQRRRASLVGGCGEAKAKEGGNSGGVDQDKKGDVQSEKTSDKKLDDKDAMHDAPPPKEPKEKPDVDMDELSGAMSAMSFVPRSVRFGRGGRKGFVRPQPGLDRTGKTKDIHG